jgi:phenylalanyl-tRNA synthetase beta chain
MQSLAGGEVLKGIVDVYPERFEPLIVPIREKHNEKILGIRIPEDKIISMLDGIEIKFIKKEEDRLYFEIPEHRREDLQREIDLIEETARLYGYSNIKSDFNFILDVSSHIDYNDNYQKFLNDLREYFIGRGFNEIISYTQQDDKKISGFGIEPVLIENPNSVLMNSMRVNLLYGMLTTLVNNINALGKDVSLRLFEMGKTFNNTDKKFIEEHHVCFALSGLDDKKAFDLKEKNFDIYEMKGELEQLLSKLNVENHELIYYNEEGNFGYFEVLINNSGIGKLHIINKNESAGLEIENDVFIVELNTYKLFESIREERKYKEISKYPYAKRDLAVLVKNELKYKDVEKVIKESGGSNLKRIDLFDVFTDKKLGDKNRSMTFSLEMSATDRTLTDEEVNKVIDKIIKNLENKLGVTLRAN